MLDGYWGSMRDGLVIIAACAGLDRLHAEMTQQTGPSFCRRPTMPGRLRPPARQ